MPAPRKYPDNFPAYVVGEKIKADYHNMKTFCEEYGFNYHTFRNVLYGIHKSRPIALKLVALGYIDHPRDLIWDGGEKNSDTEKKGERK